MSFLGTLMLALLCATARTASADDRLIDPTRPDASAAAAPSAAHPQTVRVEAILDRNGQRFAIVAGKVVRAGDRLSWGSVEEVTPTGIRYVSGGRIQVAQLEVSKLQVRRPSSGQEPPP